MGADPNSIYYAIIATNYADARDWFQQANHDKIREYVPTHAMFIMKNGDKYRIITRAQQLEGYYFVDIIVSPTYTDLLTEARKRIR